MFHPPKYLGRSVFVAASICSLVTLPACRPTPQAGTGGQMSAAAEYKQAQQQLARAAERLTKEARPITDREELARKLKLSPERFAVIKTGAQAPGPIVLAFDPSSDCKFGHCTCVGDKDCNSMFSGICASPSTDGSCEGSGDATVCTCAYSGA